MKTFQFEEKEVKPSSIRGAIALIVVVTIISITCYFSMVTQYV